MPMSFEATVGAFAAALGEPSAAPPAMTRGRFDAPDRRRFSVYRNNVAVGLMGALEARYPATRKIAGEDAFRSIARAFVSERKPRSPVMIAYGEDFPEFVAAYLVRDRDPSERVSSPLAGEEQGGGSRRPMDDGAAGRLDNLQGEHDPPPTWHSEERPSFRRATPAPTGGGGCANAIDFAPRQAALACLADLARLENAWVEAYHAGDAPAATIGDLAALGPESLPEARVAFHPAARILRFSTPAASIWASAQSCAGAAEPAGNIAEDVLITRPDADVRVRILPPLGFDFALKLSEGATLIEAALALDDPAFDFGTHLVGLVESGAVASLMPGASS